MKQTYITLTLIFIVIMQAFAQSPADTAAYNFSIADCVNYAYKHQHDIINSDLDVQSANYHIREIVGQGLPQLSGSANFQDYLKTAKILFPNVQKGILSTLIADGVKGSDGQTISYPSNIGADQQAISFTQKYNSGLALNANQILFDPNYIIGLQGRKTYKELYTRSYIRTKIDVNVNVTKAYYQVLVSIEQIKLLLANINQLKQQLDETIARNKQGFVEKIDVDRITVQYNTLVTNKNNTIRLLDLNYQLLKFQMGMPVDTPLILKDKLENITLDVSMAVSNNDSLVYKSRIEYLLLETQKRLNEFDLKSKKAQFLPKLSATANYAPAYQNNSFNDLYGTNYASSYIGLNLSLPFYTGGQHINQVRQSRINVFKSQNDLANMQNTVNLQISQARIQFINGLQTLNDQKKNQALANEVLRVSKIKYEQGVGSSIEITQAQTALQEADNTYIQGLYDALVSKVDLDKAYGRIN